MKTMQCKSAGRKISMMAMIAKYLSVSKQKLPMKSFFESLFDYCPMIFMFCGRTLDKNVSTLHERALRIAYINCTSTFNALLDEDSNVLFGA